jgi:hypothetical protein
MLSVVFLAMDLISPLLFLVQHPEIKLESIETLKLIIQKNKETFFMLQGQMVESEKN